MSELDGYRSLGDLSIVLEGGSVIIVCTDCKVYWAGCADAHECPECGKGYDWHEDIKPVFNEAMVLRCIEPLDLPEPILIEGKGPVRTRSKKAPRQW